MLKIFLKGGPVMWPLLLLSAISLSVVIERLIFVFLERWKRNNEATQKILDYVEQGNIPAAIKAGQGTKDYVARVLSYGLQHRQKSLTSALLSSANRELKKFNRGLPILDTAITLAPLLGLLGTVTGIIRSFGLLGSQELGAPTVITGGIAEALIATAFGLGIAIMALIPFNYLNARLEEARHEIEDSTTRLELLLMQQPQEGKEASP